MRMSWRMFRSLIPPTLGLSDDDQRRIIGDAMRRWRGTQGSRWHTVVQCVLIIPLVVLLNSRQFGLLRFLPDWAQMPVLIGVVFGYLIAGVYFARFFGLPRCLYTELRDLGHDVCGRCGYHRDGLSPLARCPECGVTRLDPVGGGGL